MVRTAVIGWAKMSSCYDQRYHNEFYTMIGWATARTDPIGPVMIEAALQWLADLVTV